ncbi:hypothetical protein T265_10161 [Opisthorchis viverrini]|uniref:Uncharacterized protein n=1 Tax=Opisthorchis viverrini TaxID=6198 RepID=A0A074Z3E4_OPIVI|nr:hypothetical protein T265_10161 [Opisthorchis viverrini]KER21538.1 hypothetical protein T265_10161 [Opisthorchis viverrini]
MNVDHALIDLWVSMWRIRLVSGTEPRLRFRMKYGVTKNHKLNGHPAYENAYESGSRCGVNRSPRSVKQMCKMTRKNGGLQNPKTKRNSQTERSRPCTEWVWKNSLRVRAVRNEHQDDDPESHSAVESEVVAVRTIGAFGPLQRVTPSATNVAQGQWKTRRQNQPGLEAAQYIELPKRIRFILQTSTVLSEWEIVSGGSTDRHNGDGHWVIVRAIRWNKYINEARIWCYLTGKLLQAPVSERAKDQTGTITFDERKHFDCWTKDFEQQFLWPSVAIQLDSRTALEIRVVKLETLAAPEVYACIHAHERHGAAGPDASNPP